MHLNTTLKFYQLASMCVGCRFFISFTLSKYNLAVYCTENQGKTLKNLASKIVLKVIKVLVNNNIMANKMEY